MRKRLSFTGGGIAVAVTVVAVAAAVTSSLPKAAVAATSPDLAFITVPAVSMADTLTLVEAVTYTGSVRWAETPTLNDVLGAAITREPFTEGATLSDAMTVSYGANVAEGATLSDNLTMVVSYVRAFDETPTLSDEVSISLRQGNDLNAHMFNTVTPNR